MGYKCFIQALIDGILSIIGLISLELLITSVLFANMYATIPLLFVSIAPVALLSVVYLMFLRSRKSKKELIYFSLVSSLIFAFGMIICFIFSLSLSFEIPFQRELCNADGFLIIISASCYLSTLIILKMIILICQITQKGK